MSPKARPLSDSETRKLSLTTFLNIVENLGKSVLRVLFPVTCVGCGRGDDWFCPDCLAKVKLVEYFICPSCGQKSLKGFTHLICRKEEALDRLISIYQFKSPIKEAIHRLKYRQEIKLAEVLAAMMFEDIQDFALDFGFDAFIVPVPMYFGKLADHRYFNHAELLAEDLGKHLRLKVRRDLLKRVFGGESQTKLSRVERQKNVADVFWVPWWRRRDVNGRDILLIDDVCTTAATLNSCARTLKKAGARFVWGLTVAQD